MEPCSLAKHIAALTLLLIQKLRELTVQSANSFARDNGLGDDTGRLSNPLSVTSARSWTCVCLNSHRVSRILGFTCGVFWPDMIKKGE